MVVLILRIMLRNGLGLLLLENQLCESMIGERELNEQVVCIRRNSRL